MIDEKEFPPKDQIASRALKRVEAPAAKGAQNIGPSSFIVDNRPGGTHPSLDAPTSKVREVIGEKN